eukprot:1344890-Amorphochlora_amoeboformis.AAC.1
MASSEFTSPVRVEIPSARSAGIKSKYTVRPLTLHVYVIVVSWVNSGNAWTTQRRFREFSKLHKTVRSRTPCEWFAVRPTTATIRGLPKDASATTQDNLGHNPDPGTGTSLFFSLAFVEKRRALLEKYLQELIKIEV